MTVNERSRRQLVCNCMFLVIHSSTQEAVEEKKDKYLFDYIIVSRFILKVFLEIISIVDIVRPQNHT